MSEIEGDKRLKRIMCFAETVFGAKEKAARWMSKPKKMFDGLTPKDMVIRNEVSADLVEKLLKKIEHGHF